MKSLILALVISLLPLMAQAQTVIPTEPVHVQELHEAIEARKSAVSQAAGMADEVEKTQAQKVAREDFWNRMHTIFDEPAPVVETVPVVEEVEVPEVVIPTPAKTENVIGKAFQAIFSLFE